LRDSAGFAPASLVCAHRPWPTGHPTASGPRQGCVIGSHGGREGHTGEVRVAVVVLAGGTARRWGGRDKTAVLLGDRTVLEHAVQGLLAGVREALPGEPRDHVPDGGGLSVPVVVAGPSDQAERPGLVGVRWVREDPPGGGPVPGLAAAVAALAGDVEDDVEDDVADDVRVDVVVVGAGDAPFAGSAVPRLLAALDERVDGAVGVDGSGRRQPLLAAYRLPALRSHLEELADPSGAPLRAVVGRLRVADVPVTEREALDLDTPAALDEAVRELMREPAVPEPSARAGGEDGDRGAE
jgi:molybdopterin-guanine dinucleotide biosynthesis protein A